MPRSIYNIHKLYTVPKCVFLILCAGYCILPANCILVNIVCEFAPPVHDSSVTGDLLAYFISPFDHTRSLFVLTVTPTVLNGSVTN